MRTSLLVLVTLIVLARAQDAEHSWDFSTYSKGIVPDGGEIGGWPAKAVGPGYSQGFQIELNANSTGVVYSGGSFFDVLKKDEVVVTEFPVNAISLEAIIKPYSYDAYGAVIGLV